MILKLEAEHADDKEQFVVNLTDACKTHEDWLSVVRFGFRDLLKDDALLMEVIVREAARENARAGVNGRVVADDARAIYNELGLKLVDGGAA